MIALVLIVAPAHAVTLDEVSAKATRLAASSYQKPASSVPRSLKALSYDQHRDIRYRPERALWRDTKLPFEIMFFHPGSYYEDTVTIHEVDPTGERQQIQF